MRYLTIVLSMICVVCHPIKAQTDDETLLANYKLKKLVMVGRHGVRSASLTKSERRITPHTWHKWREGDGQLTERGAILEQQMGHYFREWLRKMGLFVEEDSQHAADCYVYANSMPRTVDTAVNFLAGFMPGAGIDVNYNKNVAFGSMDDVFKDGSSIASNYFIAKVKAEAESACGEGGFAAVMDSLENDAKVLSQLLDMDVSPACQHGDTCSFDFSGAYIYLHKSWMPRIAGGNIYLAQMAASDCLLQYYDIPDTEHGLFGHELSDEDIIRVGHIKDMWIWLSMGMPSIGKDIAHHLLVKLRDVLEDDEHHFAYLVGHDSNMSSLTGALNILPYVLPGTPEIKTPLGGKLVFEIWENQDGDTLARVRYVYQSLDQIRNLESLGLDNPPSSYPLAIRGQQPNSDGLYPWRDVLTLIHDAINDYATLDDPLPNDVNLDEVVDMLDVVDIVKFVLKQPFLHFYQPQADVDGDGMISVRDALQLMNIISGFPKKR